MSRENQGFTLIELIVVISIIGILAGIAVTILFSSRKMAQEITAKHDLKKFVEAEDAYYLEFGRRYYQRRSFCIFYHFFASIYTFYPGGHHH